MPMGGRIVALCLFYDLHGGTLPFRRHVHRVRIAGDRAEPRAAAYAIEESTANDPLEEPRIAYAGIGLAL